jgi:hypothetical protein
MSMLVKSAPRVARRLALAALLFATAAGAQSAADKATARQLATQGVELYGQGKFAEALDKMQRAERLYDAPVHLIYIARAQVKLGKLVEGAETYRRLARTQLGSGAPEVFQQAVADAKTELAALEPKIPALRIEVEPADAEDLKLAIDGNSLSAAVVGVDRPTNPGSHKVTASAPGYAETEEGVTLGEGDKKVIKLVLKESAEGGGAAGAGGGKGEGGAGEVSPQPSGNLGFVLGLRMGGVVPTGNLATDQFGDVAITDYYGGGGGLELRGGVRFAHLFTGHIFGGGYSIKSGGAFDDPAFDAGPGNSQIESQSTLTQAGLGVVVGTPPGEFGGFGELDFVFINNFATTQTIKGTVGTLPPAPPQTVPVDCSVDVTAKSRGVRLGGGVNIPLSRSFQLSPTVMGTIATITQVDVADCGPFRNSSYDIPKDKRATHMTLFIGAGIDWLLGPDIPSK